MKLSISNIAWNKNDDEIILSYLHKNHFAGLEIAPTKWFPNQPPYEYIEEAKKISEQIEAKYKLFVASIQSIWYGRTEKIFSSEKERKALLLYTKKAILFAEALNCKNLVFGCPKNRTMKSSADIDIAIQFFNELGNYASQHNTMIAIEPNPSIYGTNFLNDTKTTLAFVKDLNNVGIGINLDLGTMICNQEDLDIIYESIPYINHVHISEPNLKPVKQREIHKELHYLLKAAKYENFVSIEMGIVDSIEQLKNIIDYINKIFK